MYTYTFEGQLLRPPSSLIPTQIVALILCAGHFSLIELQAPVAVVFVQPSPVPFLIFVDELRSCPIQILVVLIVIGELPKVLQPQYSLQSTVKVPLAAAFADVIDP